MLLINHNHNTTMTNTKLNIKCFIPLNVTIVSLCISSDITGRIGYSLAAV